MDVKELITMAERCRRLARACNDDHLAEQFRTLANEYRDRARQVGALAATRKQSRPARARLSEGD